MLDVFTLVFFCYFVWLLCCFLVLGCISGCTVGFIELVFDCCLLDG